MSFSASSSRGPWEAGRLLTRVYNRLDEPDGMTWVEVLKDEAMVGLHAALTPTWSETAIFADYVLPMGHAGERHDIQSQETQSGKWVSFRQPVLRAARERLGEKFRFTYEANPGEVWEEDEFWIELSWRIDPDGALGIRVVRIARTAGRESTAADYTVGSSRTPSPACPRPRPVRASPPWTTCAGTARS